MKSARHAGPADKTGVHAAALRYFQEVARQGSIRRAAGAMNVASSAINRQILKMEDGLGIKLFDRLADGVRLTQAGEILLRHVRDTLNGYEQAVAGIDGLRGVWSGHIRIATLDSLLLQILPDVLGAFAETHPEVTFSVSAKPAGEVLRKLGEGEADLGLTFVAPTGSSISEVASIAAPVGAVMTRDHRLAGRPDVALDDLLAETLLVQQGSLNPALGASSEFASFRARARQRVVSDDIGFVKRMVRRGLGVALYTGLGFAEEVASGELAWVPVRSAELAGLRVGLFAPTLRTPTPACHALAGAVAQRLRAWERGAAA